MLMAAFFLATPIEGAEGTTSLGDINLAAHSVNDTEAGWVKVTNVNFTLTIENPPAASGVTGQRPLVLMTKEPVVWQGKPASFPPRGDVYQLQNTVQLVLPEKPDQVFGIIEKFLVKVGGI